MADAMGNLEYAREWFYYAEMDLSSAEYLQGHCPIPSEIICFHCQQAAEKCLKALLVIQGIRPPKIHELDTLYHLCEPFAQNIQEIQEACTFLNRHGVMPRYPNELLITEQTIPLVLMHAKKVMDFSHQLFIA
jgi:HEPN domain-containing protein